METRPPPKITTDSRPFFPSTSTSAIVGGLLAAVLLILLLACFASSRLIARQKGEYVTHEDAGAESALDPDTAVMHSPTGPDVSEKKEYFI